MFPFTFLGTLSYCVYVDLNGSDQTDCGIRPQPCRSLSYTINNVSRPNGNICLIASPIKQIRYSLEKSIVINHSLTVTKSPLFSVNPVIIYPVNVTSKWKEFYAFTSFGSADADEMLSLKIKSVNFNVNIFTALSEGKRYPLSLSITDSIINCPNHAVHITDLSGYENVSIYVKDSIIQNGRFILKNKRESCKAMEHVRNIVKMSNVTIVNKGTVALNVNGCFNVAISKLKCSNIRWQIKELFMFKGNSLNLKNILIENVLSDNSHSQGKALFLIYSCAMNSQNVHIVNCKGPSSIRLHQTFAVFLAQNSFVKMRDMEVIGNSIKTFIFAESKSRISMQNSVFINNFFTEAIYNISKKSTLGIDNSSFLQNNMQVMLFMKSNSSAIIQNSTLTENNVLLVGCVVLRMNTIQLNNVAFTRNNFKKNLLYLVSNSTGIIQNNTLTENNVSFAGCVVLRMSTIQLNNVAFTRNNFKRNLLYLVPNSTGIIQNNTLTENNVSWAAYYLHMASTIQLNNVAFTRNNFKGILLCLGSNSTGIIQNNTLTENNVSFAGCAVLRMSTIQLNNVAFTRNNFKRNLLFIRSDSNAIIQNNTLNENSVKLSVYHVHMKSTIQLNDVAFTQNNIKENLLFMLSNCSAIVKNNTIIRNNINGRVFDVHGSSLRTDTISLHNNTLVKYLMFAISSDNISLDLMRISDNTFKSGIIHIKNCTGRLADTYIENYDHFSVSAITVTCAYDGQNCFPFEFTNNSIVWNNKLLFSVRPIIELTGTIIISNVNVSVASITEIEALRYSTEDVIIQIPFYKKYSNVYKISSLFITCTKANVKHMATFDTVRCTPCAQDTYTLNNGSIKISSRILKKKKHEFQNESTHFTCSGCPVGGNCTEYIKSKSNFYGYRTRQQEIEFVPCPWNFCRTADLCKAIDSCNKRRTGTLCGRCSKNNTESFLSTNCIPVNRCQNFAEFWLIYCVYAFSLATCLYYMKDLIVLMKTAGSKVSKVFKCFLKDKESKNEIELVVEVVGAEEHLGKISHFTVSGIFALIVSFYQVKQVMAIDVEYNNASGFLFVTFISKFLNLEIIAMNSSSYCPLNDLNAVSKAFMKTYLLTAALIMASLGNYFVSLFYYSFEL